MQASIEEALIIALAGGTSAGGRFSTAILRALRRTRTQQGETLMRPERDLSDLA